MVENERTNATDIADISVTKTFVTLINFFLSGLRANSFAGGGWRMPERKVNQSMVELYWKFRGFLCTDFTRIFDTELFQILQ
jgi:hypothetical protein